MIDLLLPLLMLAFGVLMGLSLIISVLKSLRKAGITPQKIRLFLWPDDLPAVKKVLRLLIFVGAGYLGIGAIPQFFESFLIGAATGEITPVVIAYGSILLRIAGMTALVMYVHGRFKRNSAPTMEATP